MNYHTATIDAMEVETRLRQHFDDLVRQSGDRALVYRLARLVMDDLRAASVLEIAAKQVQVEQIMKAVAAAHNLPFRVLRERDRTHKIAWCRHHAVWEIRQRRPDLSLSKISLWFDRDNHTTTMNSIRKFNRAIKDGRFAGERALVERALSC